MTIKLAHWHTGALALIVCLLNNAPAMAQQEDLVPCRFHLISWPLWAENRDGAFQMLTPKTGCQQTYSGGIRSTEIITPPSNGTLRMISKRRLFYVPKAGAVSDEMVLKRCGSNRRGKGCSTVTYKIVIQ